MNGKRGRPVMVLVALLAAGCANGGGAAPAVPATDPKAALAASTRELAARNFAFTADTPDYSENGRVHLPSGSAAADLDMQGQQPFGAEIVVVGADRWVRLTASAAALADGRKRVDTSGPQGAELTERLQQAAELYDGTTWLHSEETVAQQTGEADLDLSDPDLLGVATLLADVDTAHGDGRTISGTLDATKARSRFLKGQKALPFVATLDDSGRLSELTIDAPAGTWALTVSGYGAQTAVARPTGTITEMPAGGVRMFTD